MYPTPQCRGIVWIGRSQRDFNDFPERAKELFDLALREAQRGDHPSIAKPLKGFAGAGVLELTSNSSTGAFRVVYTVKIKNYICVLHCFQKKSTSGIKTLKQDIDTVKLRLAQAQKEYGK